MLSNKSMKNTHAKRIMPNEKKPLRNLITEPNIFYSLRYNHNARSNCIIRTQTLSYNYWLYLTSFTHTVLSFNTFYCPIYAIVVVVIAVVIADIGLHVNQYINIFTFSNTKYNSSPFLKSLERRINSAFAFSAKRDKDKGTFNYTWHRCEVHSLKDPWYLFNRLITHKSYLWCASIIITSCTWCMFGCGILHLLAV